MLRECGVKDKIVDKLQILPAGHYDDSSLPGRKFWLSDFWGHVLIPMRKRNQASLVALGGLGRGFQSEGDVIKDQSSTTKSPIYCGDFYGSIWYCQNHWGERTHC